MKNGEWIFQENDQPEEKGHLNKQGIVQTPQVHSGTWEWMVNKWNYHRLPMALVYMYVYIYIAIALSLALVAITYRLEQPWKLLLVSLSCQAASIHRARQLIQAGRSACSASKKWAFVNGLKSNYGQSWRLLCGFMVNFWLWRIESFAGYGYFPFVAEKRKD